MRQTATMLTVCALLIAGGALSQKATAKFGKVSAEDFKPTSYEIDTGAAAVVIADIGSARIEGNNKGWFSVNYKHYKRVHILNKNGYDIANVEIPLYTDGRTEENLNKVKAVTYNLENGKVVETKLEKNAIFKDKKSRNVEVKKFTFPNIKEGSIIEFEYEIESDFLFNLYEPWEFQGAYPRLWSEYEVSIPEFFGYVFLSQGYRNFDIRENKQRFTSFSIIQSQGASASERFKLDANVTDYRWVMKDVPALKEEGYTSTLDNHIAKIDFQLSEYKRPLDPHDILGTWPQLSKRLLESEDFGDALGKNNNWLSDVVDPLVKGVASEEEKARRIFYYVESNFTCTSYNSRLLDKTLKEVLKSRNGSVADINLLLTAMLRYADLKVDPVVLSTKAHGYTYPMYPLINRFNYVLARLWCGGKFTFLDASHPGLGYGKLTPDCYNGHARVIDVDATPLDFSADSLLERKVTSVYMSANEKGELTGKLTSKLGYFESFNIREKIKEKGEENFFNDLRKQLGDQMEMSQSHLDSLDKLEQSLVMKYDFTFNNNGEDIIYLDPMLKEGWKENPFKSAERFYPVEMPFAFDENYVFALNIPVGYEVDELPKPMIVKLNEEGDGQFEYRIAASNGVVSMRSRVYLKRTFYTPAEYEMLREFFNLVVKKHSEQIVLKKKTGKP